MGDMIRLHRLLMELDDDLASCMRCGMCQARCPVFGATGRETDVARGKLALLDHLAHDLIHDPEQVRERLDRCLLCGRCQAGCPSGVGTQGIFLKARAVLAEYGGMGVVQKAILRFLLPRPKLMDRVVRLGSRLTPLVAGKKDGAAGVSCARFPLPVLGQRHFPAPAKDGFSARAGDVEGQTEGEGPKVLFYAGCMVEHIYPRVGLACMDIFRHHGVRTVLPDAPLCCGIPAVASGDMDGFRAMVRALSEEILRHDADHIVTPCATCASTLVETWPSMIPEGPLSAEARMVAARTMDMTAFMARVLGVCGGEGEAAGGTVAYHDPCHLALSLGVSEEPRAVLRAANLRLSSLDSECCGCGGSFNLKHYDLSSVMGLERAGAIAATGADVAATACPACMMQLTDMLSRSGHDIRVAHVAELYAESVKETK